MGNIGSRGRRLTGRAAAGRHERDESTTDPDQLDLGLRIGLHAAPRRLSHAGDHSGRGQGDDGPSTSVRRPSATPAAATDAMPHATPGLPDCVRLTPHGLAGVGLALLAALPRAAGASTGGAAMPWDTPLQNLLSNLSGPTARALVLIAIVACGLLWAFTRNEEGLKKLGQVAFGGAIALGAVTLVTSLGFAGATF